MFTKQEQRTIKKVYNGTWESIKILIVLLQASKGRILWETDHKSFKEKHTRCVYNWAVKHPKQIKIINAKAHKKWYQKPGVKIQVSARQRAYYWKNRKYILLKQAQKYKRSNKIK